MKAFHKHDIIEKIWHRELAPFVCDDGCDCFRLIVWSSHEWVLSLSWHFQWVVWEGERERLRFSVSQVMQYKSLFRPRLKLFIYTKAHCVYVWSRPLCLPATGHLILYYWMKKTAEERMGAADPHPHVTRIPPSSHRPMEEMCRETPRSFWTG